ncbi:MAG: ribose 5-phosphate isomerase B [Atopobiaceae bacterium]|jgi:ribose 5-phosphate isomerase B|nr:ribose 5-phosphate isomerase B [Atopobiaceae bacterium]MCI2173562.1 ribose 5-phosphate isomerase B [Atopobiaceae bacterium]MCI2207796.1 ribose 5-phosphate isomerase B [Atopobiaceae bacterium]
MRVAIASDHAGFCQKDPVEDYVRGLGYEVIDMGPADDSRVDYPDFADKVATAVADGSADRGILICGTGLGMAMTADKVPGIRAAAVQTVDFAELARKHNDANVICLSGRFVDLAVNEGIARTFLETDFEGGRHAQRVAKIMKEDER